jgi:hypothetical protein
LVARIGLTARPSIDFTSQKAGLEPGLLELGSLALLRSAIAQHKHAAAG